MKEINFQNRGQSLIGIIIVLVVVGLINGGLYYYLQKQIPEIPKITEKPKGEEFVTPEEGIIPLLEEELPKKEEEVPEEEKVEEKSTEALEEVESEVTEPEVACQNECSQTGLKRCSNNGYQICGNYDTDNCLEWGLIINCPVNTICQNGSCAQLAQLQSNFFKNNPTAQAVIGGTIYQMSENNYLTEEGNIKSTSFEYKVINTFRQLGYVKLTFTIEPTDTSVNVALHKFQKKHNLSTTDFIDKNLMLLLDSEIAKREKLDKELAKRYPSYIKFIEAPINEPSKEHLAALYASFSLALPETISTDTEGENNIWTIDQFRRSLTSNRFHWLGEMLNVNANRIFTYDEMQKVVNEKSDFRYCGRYYYKAYYGRDCLTPSAIQDQSFASDFTYMTFQVHEFGHGVGFHGEYLKRNHDEFGKISFSGPMHPAELLRPENNDGEFISGYAKTNALEDFAESFTAYMHMGNIFRARAKLNYYLKQKYDFLKEYIFQGIEYNTGNIKSLNLWESKNLGIPWHPEDYLTDDPNFVWDYKYLVK